MLSAGHESDDDEAPANQDRDYTSNNQMRVRWRGFRDDCAVGIETFNVTLLWLAEAEGGNASDSNYSTVNDDLNDRPREWIERNTTLVGRGIYGPYAREMGFHLEDPGLYRVRVCGTAVTGLTACALSDGIRYDVSVRA